MPAGNLNTAAMIRIDGSLVAWGINTDGQLAQGVIGYPANSLSPILIEGGPWKKVSFGGEFSVGLTLDGRLFGWGKNSQSQLGDNTILSSASPKQIGTDSDWEDVECGYFHVLAKKVGSGSLWGWGWNAQGQMGIPTATAKIGVPTVIPGISDVKSFACGYYHSMVVTNAGELYGTGNNSYGELANGLTANLTAFTRIGTGTSWSDVYCGGNNTALKKTDLTMCIVGYNGTGMCGVSNTTSPNHTQSFVWVNVKMAYLSTGNTLVVKNDGSLWCAGDATSNIKGNNVTGTGNQTSPLQIGTATNWDTIVSAGGTTFIGVTIQRDVYCWGTNTSGGLGNGTPTTAPQLTPVKNTLFSKVAFPNDVIGTIPVYKFLVEDAGSVKKVVIPLGYTDVTPVMTSNVLPSPYVASASSEYSPPTFAAFQAFNAGGLAWYSATGAYANSWLQLDMGVGNEKTCTRYGFNTYNAGETVSAFTLQASNDGTTFTDIDVRTGTGNVWNTDGVTPTYFIIANPGNYRYYRLKIVTASTTTNVVVKSMKYFTSPAPSWEVVGSAPLSLAQVQANGTQNIASVTDAIWKMLGTTTPKIGFDSDIVGLAYNASISALPKPQLILANGDFRVVDTSQINSITLTATVTGTGTKLLTIVSPNAGVTWYTWNGIAWVTILPNTTDVGVGGMTIATINARAAADWTALFSSLPKMETIRFGYYLEQTSMTDTVYTDTIKLNVNLKGSWESTTHSTQYTYSRMNDTIMFKLKESGSWKVNYM